MRGNICLPVPTEAGVLWTYEHGIRYFRVTPKEPEQIDSFSSCISVVAITVEDHVTRDPQFVEYPI